MLLAVHLLTLGWEKAERKIDLLQKLCGKYNGNLFFERNFLNLIKSEEKNTARLAVNYGDFFSIFDLNKKNLSFRNKNMTIKKFISMHNI